MIPRHTFPGPHSLAHHRAAEFAIHAGPSTRRYLSFTAARSATPVGHYEALSLSRNATKQQIKARFYELSKKHHPDAPGGSAAKFHEINDAYATLGDESKRRQYDQSTLPARTSSSSSSFRPHSPHLRHHRSSGPSASWGRSAPRSASGGPTAGAGGHYNPFGRRAPPDYNTGPSPSFSASGGGTASGSYARAGADPFNRATYGQKRKNAHNVNHDDGNGGESGLWRFGVVVGLMLAIVGFGGGLTASADSGFVEGPGNGE